jgi:pimeloyl-ACP methyl ester carboxylesterase
MLLKRALATIKPGDILMMHLGIWSRKEPFWTELDPLIAGRWLEGIDWPKVAQRIECPTVLLQADFGAGGALSDEDAKSFSQGCKNCQWIPFPGKNHQLHGTVPGQIASIINRVMQGASH